MTRWYLCPKHLVSGTRGIILNAPQPGDSILLVEKGALSCQGGCSKEVGNAQR